MSPKLPAWELAEDLDQDARILGGLRPRAERALGSALRSKCGAYPEGAARWATLHRDPQLLLGWRGGLCSGTLLWACRVLGEGLRAAGCSESDLGLVTVSHCCFSDHKASFDNWESSRHTGAEEKQLHFRERTPRRPRITNVNPCRCCRLTTTWDTRMRRPGTTCPCAF